jgi:peptidoglycan/xylan/chitin deacetylase (PgdA/CDA1 family)/glycosyltransferase involved in cell wall biosynthesis
VSAAPALSVVVPTYQRRDVVLATLHALGRQDTTDPFEVVVVVDGSTDGTAAAVAAVDWPFELQLLEQDNHGLAVTRNRGARAARAPLVLFIDDDMEADPGLVRVHLEAHRSGAEAVVGAMPLHPDSPKTILAEGVGRWADELAERCAQPGYELGPDDIFGGQLSIGRDLFFRLGGFDERFTAEGEFGNEDVDLSHRLVAGGHRVVFRGDAITYQRFVVDGAEHLRRWVEVGEADMRLARLHPELDPSLRAAALTSPPPALLDRVFVSAPRLVRRLLAPLRRIGVLLVDRGAHDPFTVRLWPRLHRAAYWTGVGGAGGPLDGRRVVVLCWHAITDLSHDPVLAAYGVPPAIFAEQLRTLRDAGWVAVSPDELHRFLDGGAVPRRAFMVTFDDCTADLATQALPILAEARVPATAFVVTQRAGEWNRWDDHLGVTRLPLADWPDLQAVNAGGVELGAHSRTHPMLPRIERDALASEVEGPARDLADQGLPRPRLFAYPHGEHDAQVREAVRAAGYESAFTVEPGAVRRGADRFALARVEVTPRDRGWRLRWRVRTGGRPAFLWRSSAEHRASARRQLRRARRVLGRLGPAGRGATAR